MKLHDQLINYVDVHEIWSTEELSMVPIMTGKFNR